MVLGKECDICLKYQCLSSAAHLVSKRESWILLGSVDINDTELIPGTKIICQTNEGGGASLGNTIVDDDHVVYV